MSKVRHFYSAKRLRSLLYSRKMSRSVALLLCFGVVVGIQVTRHVTRERNNTQLPSALNPQWPSTRIPRMVYPFSVVAGGVESAAEVQAAVDDDLLIAAHYSAIAVPQLKPVKQVGDVHRYASYRMDGAIYWTSKPVTIKDGELLLTDGATTLRGRCGNMLSETPREPTRHSAFDDAVADELDNPIWLGYMPRLRFLDTPPTDDDTATAVSTPELMSTGTSIVVGPRSTTPMPVMPPMPSIGPFASNGVPYIPGMFMPIVMFTPKEPLDVIATPEPSAIVMTILGLAGLFWLRRMFTSARGNV